MILTKNTKIGVMVFTITIISPIDTKIILTNQTFFQVNDAEVVDSNILTSSGVIHTINKVLLPDDYIDG